MRAISVWQPHASLWLTPAKIHETRHWSTTYRGPVAVHAALKVVPPRTFPAVLTHIMRTQFDTVFLPNRYFGAVIGVVEIIDCLATEDVYNASIDYTRIDDFHCGDFTPGRFAFKRSPQVRAFKNPIPWKGRQGWFDVPDEIIARAA